MSKRLSPHRRLIAKQRALFRELASEHLANDDSYLLQQGKVKSVLSSSKLDRVGYTMPRGERLAIPAPDLKSGLLARAVPDLVGGSGKRGKVVNGKFKPVKVVRVLSPPKSPSLAVQELLAQAKARKRT